LLVEFGSLELHLRVIATDFIEPINPYVEINFDPFISLPSGGGDNDQGWSEPDDSFPEDFEDVPEPDNIEYSDGMDDNDRFDNFRACVDAVEFNVNLAVDTSPHAPMGIRAGGVTLSMLSASITGYSVYKQLKKGGINSVKPADATSFSVSVFSLSIKGLSWYGIGGRVISVLGSGIDGVGYAIFIGSLWWETIYKPMDDLQYAPSYIDSNGTPVYSSPDPWPEGESW
jgi:hypothetical protein